METIKQAQSNTIKTNIDYAKQLLKASFYGCSIEDRRTFATSSCFLPISVGGKAHEGKRFIATIKLINKSFKTCHILVADTLHRYSLKIDHPNQDFAALYQQARDNGMVWIQQNKEIYKQLTIPYKIVRWDEYLNHNLFQEKLDIINNLYDTDLGYRNAFDSNIEEYLSRYRKKMDSSIFDFEAIRLYCLEYLKEESAVACLLVNMQYNFEIYPSLRVESLQATYEKIIWPSYPNIAKPVALRFNK